MRPLPSIQHLRTQVDRLVGARDAAQRHLEQTRKAIKDLEREEDLLALVQTALREMIDREVTTGVAATEKLLTEGLQAVFTDQHLVVESEVSVQRGKVGVDLVTVYTRPDGVVIRGLGTDSFGGSVASLQSVLIRILVMRRRGLRPLLLLDEALPGFDNHYVYNMGAFLNLVCARLGIDMLLVTFSPAMVEAANRAYRIVKTKSGAKFELLRGPSRAITGTVEHANRRTSPAAIEAGGLPASSEASA